MLVSSNVSNYLPSVININLYLVSKCSKKGVAFSMISKIFWLKESRCQLNGELNFDQTLNPLVIFLSYFVGMCSFVLYNLFTLNASERI